MNNDANKNGPSSATTTETEQKAQAKLSEAQFLQQTAAELKAAISQTVSKLKDDALTAADIRLWSKEHPWAVVGAAAAAGFVAATLVTPSKDRALKEKFAELIDVLKADERGEKRPEQQPAGSGMFAPLLAMAAGAAQNYVMSLVHPPVNAQPQDQSTSAETGNGAARAGSFAQE